MTTRTRHRLALSLLSLLATACLKPAPEPVDAGVDAAQPVHLGHFGASCALDSDCASGSCLVDCEGQPYCSTPCSGGSDCAGAEGSYCCTAGGWCERSSALNCGDGQGGVGASCAGTGNSACQAGLVCVDRCLAGAFCSSTCSQDDDCAVAGPTYACLLTPGGQRRCVEDPDLRDACQRDLDCDFATTGTTCQLAVSWRGTHTVTICAPPSPYVETGPVGAPINGGLGDSCIFAQDGQPYYDECLANFCWTAPAGDNTCGAFCVEDADCSCPHLPAAQCVYHCAEESFTAGTGSSPTLHRVCKRGAAPTDAGVDGGSEDAG